jgi:hypothetical protein
MQTKRILIAGIVLILLVVATIITIGLLPRDENNNIVSPAWVVAVEEERVARIEVSNTFGEYTATFDNGVTILGYENYPLSEHTKTNMRPAVGSVYAYDTVDRSGKDLGKYGFNAPTATATLTDTNGKQIRFTVGSQMPNGTAYYVMNDTNNHVYAVASDYLQFIVTDKQEFISKQVTSIPADSAYMVDYMTITKNGAPYFSVVAMDESETVFQNSGALFKMTYPYVGQGRDVNIVSFLESVCNLNATFVKHLSTDADALAQYGLSDPAIVIEYSYKGDVKHIYLSEPENGFTNLYTPDSNIIYSLLAQKLNLVTLDGLDFVTPYQFDRDINEVERIILRTDSGEEYTYNVSVTNGKTAATCNGTNLNGAAFENFYDLLTTSEVAGVAEKPGGTPKLTMVFRYHANLNKSNDTVSFYRIDERTYYLELNGQGNFYVSSLYVDKILECIPKLNNGEDFSIKY